MDRLTVVFSIVLQASVVATVLAGALWVFERLAAALLRAVWRHVLWWLVVVALVFPVVLAGGGLVQSTIGPARPLFPPTLGGASLGRATAAGKLASPPPVLAEGEMPSLAGVGGNSTWVGQGRDAGDGSGWVPWGRPVQGALFLAARLWLGLAVAGLVLWMVWLLAAGRRLNRDAVPPDRRLAERFGTLRRSVPGCRRARLLVSRSIGGPAVFGLLQPRVCLPVGLAERLSDEELDHVLRHELTHIRRHDHGLSLVLQAVRLLHWFNPAVWLIGAHIDRLRELACDEAVVDRLDAGGRQAYGATLICLASQPRFAFNFPVPGMSRPFDDIKRRIIMIGKPITRRRFGLALFLAALVLAGCVAVAGNALPVFPSEAKDGGKSIPADVGQVTGSWKAVDFVKNREDFVPGKPHTAEADLWVKQLSFASDGTVYTKSGNDNLRWSSWRLDGATLLGQDGKTIPWFLSGRDGKEYLAVAWNVAGQASPTRGYHYVFERIDTKDLRGYQPKRLVPPDNLDRPFVADPYLVGIWRVDDFVAAPAEYQWGKHKWMNGGMTRLEVKAEGKAQLTMVTEQAASGQGPVSAAAKMEIADIAWTKGALLLSTMDVVMPYRLETIDGRQTLWIEWRNGDVIYGGEKPWYYVLVRE